MSLRPDGQHSLNTQPPRNTLLPTPSLNTPLLPTPSNKPTNHRILLKHINPTSPTNKQDIFRITFQELDAPLTRLTPTKTGFYANTDDPAAVDKLTSPKAIQHFRSINIQPVIPPEQRSKRTIFIRQLDSHVGEHTPEQLKHEIEQQNPWIKLTEVIKIKQYTHLIKIICSETSTATKILQNGLQMFNTRTSPHQCEREKYTHLLICFRCYKYEDHSSNKCTSTTKICSECSEQDHTHEHCTNNFKKCINCSGNHRTLSAGCPIRKQVITNKEAQQRKQQEDKQQQTYSNIIKKTIQETQPTAPQPIQLNSSTQIKLTALILEAHIASLAGTEKYSDILSKSLKLNYNIDTKFPDRDSAAIFKMYVNQDNITPPRPTQHQQQFDLSQDYMDDDNMEAQLPTNLSLTETEQEQHKTSSPKQAQEVKTKFKVPKNPKKRSLQPSPTTSTTTTRRRTDSESSNNMDMEMTQKETTIQTALTETEKTPQLQNIQFTLYRSNEDRSMHPKKLTTKYITEEIQTRGDFGLKLQINKKDYNTFRTLIEKPQTGTLEAQKFIKTIAHAAFKNIPRISYTQ